MLGLDQASSTGWGIAPERGPIVRHGLARTHADRLAVVRFALEYVDGDAKRLWATLEQHDHMPLDRLGRHDHKTQRKGREHGVERGPKQIYGMGKNTGRWLELLALIGVPESHIDEVRPTTWRARIHGVQRGEAVKQEAIRWASNHVGQVIENDDHAEGICITAWGAIDGFARYDAQNARKRMEARAERELGKQAVLFAMPENDNGRTRKART